MRLRNLSHASSRNSSHNHRTPGGSSSSHHVAGTTTVVVSDFDLSRMPVIYRRSLHSWSVHRTADQRFVATVGCMDTPSTLSSSLSTSSSSVRHIQRPFPTEREARKFAKAYAPPKLQPLPKTPITASSSGNSSCSSSTGYACALCEVPCASQPIRHCRNCGALICEDCTRRWGSTMVPKTYYYHSSHGHSYLSSSSSATGGGGGGSTKTKANTTTTVRVCKSCDWLSNAFCMALLQGRFADALQLYDTGNVNLRTSFADIHREAMFPVHCAVMGGSLDLLGWLVDTHLCPLFVKRNAKGQPMSVQTSACRTLLDLAMSGTKPKTNILLYLVASKGLSIHDVKDTTLASKTLESILKAGCNLSASVGASSTTTFTASSSSMTVIDDDVLMSDESVTTTAALDDPCVLCCERETDCVLIPCGHQICCTECGHQVKNCPICKVDCSVLRIFRQ